jgi:hypothetical protein
MKKILTDSYPALISLINETYADHVEQILSAGVDENENIICLAQDGLKQLAILISDTDIKIKLAGGDVPDVNLDEVEDESEKEDDAVSEFTEQPDPIEPILTQLKPIGDATFTEWFTTIQGLMQESDNLVEFRDKLTDAYPDLDAESFKSAMLDASTIAGMSGYLAASTDAKP